jgi:hypothetical protein
MVLVTLVYCGLGRMRTVKGAVAAETVYVVIGVAVLVRVSVCVVVTASIELANV